MKLQRPSKKGKPTRVPSLLRYFNVPYNSRRGLWIHNDKTVLLSDAQRNYKQMIKRCHPDVGGSPEKACEVNKHWTRLRKLLTRQCI